MKTLKTGIKTKEVNGHIFVYDKTETIMNRLSKLQWFTLLFKTVFLTLIAMGITSLIFAIVLNLIDINNW